MKANELRIGNYVNLIAEGHENEPDTFKWDIDDYEFYLDRMNFIKPIPLKEGWLFKLDNKIWSFEWYGNRLIYQHKIFKAVKIEQLPFNKWAFYFNENLIQFKSYIHEAQNLYFALTNEELNL